MSLPSPTSSDRVRWQHPLPGGLAQPGAGVRVREARDAQAGGPQRRPGRTEEVRPAQGSTPAPQSHSCVHLTRSGAYARCPHFALFRRAQPPRSALRFSPRALTTTRPPFFSQSAGRAPGAPNACSSRTPPPPRCTAATRPSGPPAPRALTSRGAAQASRRSALSRRAARPATAAASRSRSFFTLLALLTGESVLRP